MAMADPQSTMSTNPHASPAQQDLKRKRSPSHETIHAAAPLQKAAKTHNHLQINYLARQCENDLPLITNDDTLPNILSLLSEYQGVLDRHESMACNLGARPLGPILIKRFERLFDGPPRVLKSHGKDGNTVSWLDVVEFARNKPEQFQLGQMSEGVRVCQFYTKQCRVQISEEDFVLISSGIPQKMIPPQPIVEDEEKELGTIEILEKNLAQICNLADQVAARTRQLNHRLKGRKQAILDRRATASPGPPMRPASPSNVALMNGAQPLGPNVPNLAQTSPATPGGFVAVNARPHDQNGNGTSHTTRHELMSKFKTLTDRRASSQPINAPNDGRRPSTGNAPANISASTLPPPTKSSSNPADSGHSPIPAAAPLTEAEIRLMMHSPVPIPNTPSSLLPAASQRANQPQEKDDGGPFKAEMVHRMEGLQKGERIMPPCDRCRRLHMDCLKNLTACAGCTKKHAKCSWREVKESELRGSFSHHVERPGLHSEGEDVESRERASTASPGAGLSPSRQGAHPANSQNLGAPQHTSYTADVRLVPHRLSPSGAPEMEPDRGVEAQLQEAARSSLAHAHAHPRLGAADGKGPEYQTMVAS